MRSIKKGLYFVLCYFNELKNVENVTFARACPDPKMFNLSSKIT